MQQALGGPAAPTNAAQFVPLEPATLSEVFYVWWLSSGLGEASNLATHPSVTWLWVKPMILHRGTPNELPWGTQLGPTPKLFTSIRPVGSTNLARKIYQFNPVKAFLTAGMGHSTGSMDKMRDKTIKPYARCHQQKCGLDRMCLICQQSGPLAPALHPLGQN